MKTGTRTLLLFFCIILVGYGIVNLHNSGQLTVLNTSNESMSVVSLEGESFYAYQIAPLVNANYTIVLYDDSRGSAFVTFTLYHETNDVQYWWMEYASLESDVGWGQSYYVQWLNLTTSLASGQDDTHLLDQWNRFGVLTGYTIYSNPPHVGDLQNFFLLVRTDMVPPSITVSTEYVTFVTTVVEASTTQTLTTTFSRLNTSTIQTSNVPQMTVSSSFGILLVIVCGIGIIGTVYLLFHKK